jgi:hypothetical protein
MAAGREADQDAADRLLLSDDRLPDGRLDGVRDALELLGLQQVAPEGAFRGRRPGQDPGVFVAVAQLPNPARAASTPTSVPAIALAAVRTPSSSFFAAAAFIEARALFDVFNPSR